MIVLLQPDAAGDAIEEVRGAVRALGLDLVPLNDRKGRAFEVVGGDPSRVLGLRGLPGIREILTRRTALKGGEPLWPHFTLRLTVVVLLLAALLSLLSAFFPPGLGDRATGDAGGTGVVEWYLRPFAAFLELVPGAAGGWSMLALWIIFFTWPFLERTETSTDRGRRISWTLRMFGLLVTLSVVAFGIWGPHG